MWNVDLPKQCSFSFSRWATFLFHNNHETSFYLFPSANGKWAKTIKSNRSDQALLLGGRHNRHVVSTADPLSGRSFHRVLNKMAGLGDLLAACLIGKCSLCWLKNSSSYIFLKRKIYDFFSGLKMQRKMLILTSFGHGLTPLQPKRSGRSFWGNAVLKPTKRKSYLFVLASSVSSGSIFTRQKLRTPML